MVQTWVSVYDTETCLRVHANSLEMPPTQTSVSDTETCFRVDLLTPSSWQTYGLLCLTQKLISLSDMEICFHV
jgi:hypothetical protein